MGTPRQSFTGLRIGGRYRLGRELGRGGMGSVYEAVQENLGRRVAVKVVLHELAEDSEVLERFRREAETAASLGHPNIVQVTDFGHEPGEPAFLVMELLPGESLRSRLQREGTQDPAVVVSLAMQILSALGAAHRAGIVHRDLKPDNVFLVEMPGLGSLAKLLDFGIAKLAETKGYARLTATGVIIGTPTYMAPEQMSGEPVDGRTDLYALGVLMYRALAGRPPFEGKAPADLLRAILGGTGTPLTSVRPDLDPRLVQLISFAMGRTPAMRFASADEMRAALEPLATSLSSPGARMSLASPAPDAAKATVRAADARKPAAAPVAPQPPHAAQTSFTSSTSAPVLETGLVNAPAAPLAPGGFAPSSAASAFAPTSALPAIGIVPGMAPPSNSMVPGMPPPSNSIVPGIPPPSISIVPGIPSPSISIVPAMPPSIGLVPALPPSSNSLVPSIPPATRSFVPTAPKGFRARLPMAIIAVLGVTVISLISWIAIDRDDSSIASSANGAFGGASGAQSGGADPGAAVGMPSLGALSPAAQVASLRLEIVGIYAAHYHSLAELESGLRTASDSALSCLVSNGYQTTSPMPFVWAFSIDERGQYLAATATDPQGDTRVAQCLTSGASTARFPPPSNMGPTSFGVRVQIVAE